MSANRIKALLKAIREDDYRQWEQHLADFEASLKEPLSKPEHHELGLAVYDAVLHHAVANLHFEDGETTELERVKARFNLDDAEGAAIKRKYATEAVLALLGHFMIDGILTESERAQLYRFGADLDLSEAEVVALLKSAKH